MTADPEQESNERLKASIEGISTAVFNDLMQEHDVGLAEAPDLRASSFAGYSRPQMEATLRDIGINVEGGLGPASVMTLPYEPGARQIDQILWLDTAHPALKGLGDFTDYTFERHQHGFLIVAEEVSHFLYKDQYYKDMGLSRLTG
jgi:hypothetical protein